MAILYDIVKFQPERQTYFVRDISGKFFEIDMSLRITGTNYFNTENCIFQLQDCEWVIKKQPEFESTYSGQITYSDPDNQFRKIIDDYVKSVHNRKKESQDKYEKTKIIMACKDLLSRLNYYQDNNTSNKMLSIQKTGELCNKCSGIIGIKSIDACYCDGF